VFRAEEVDMLVVVDVALPSDIVVGVYDFAVPYVAEAGVWPGRINMGLEGSARYVVSWVNGVGVSAHSR